MFDCLKVCLNEKIQFGLVLQQIIRTDHLHLGVIELNLRQINLSLHSLFHLKLYSQTWL